MTLSALSGQLSVSVARIRRWLTAEV